MSNVDHIARQSDQDICCFALAVTQRSVVMSVMLSPKGASLSAAAGFTELLSNGYLKLLSSETERSKNSCSNCFDTKPQERVQVRNVYV